MRNDILIDLDKKSDRKDIFPLIWFPLVSVRHSLALLFSIVSNWKTDKSVISCPCVWGRRHFLTKIQLFFFLAQKNLQEISFSRNDDPANIQMPENSSKTWETRFQ